MNDLDRLFAAWLAGPLADADAERLVTLLRDPAQRRRWRALADLEGVLAERGAVPASGRRRWWPAAAAAAVLLAGILGWWWSRSPDPDLPRSAGVPLARSAAVGGPARLEWPDGTVADLAPGAAAAVASRGRGLALSAGTVTVVAAPQAPGRAFAVATLQATAEVVGTRFAVRCADGATSIVVDEGRVRWRSGGVERVIGAGETASAGTPAPSRDGLVAWWPLDDGAGDSARDASGNGHPLRLHGPRWRREGGRALLVFAGGDEHAAVAPRGALATLHTGDYSIVARFRPDRLPPDGATAQRDALGVIVGRTGWTLGLHVEPDGRFMMQHFLADRTPVGARTAPRLGRSGRWHLLIGIVERAAGTTRLLLDGREVARQPWTPSDAFAYPADAPWRIGISSPGAAACRWPVEGAIRDVRLYARALDAHDCVRLAMEGP